MPHSCLVLLVAEYWACLTTFPPEAQARRTVDRVVYVEVLLLLPVWEHPQGISSTFFAFVAPHCPPSFTSQSESST